MGFGFEQPPAPSPETQPEPVKFSTRSLSRIFEQLLELAQRGAVLEGSSRSYSPRELGQLVMDAIKAMDELDIRQERLIFGTGTTVDSQAFAKPGPRHEDLPEVQALTRSGGLRAAVIEARNYSERSVGQETPLSLEGRQALQALLSDVMPA